MSRRSLISAMVALLALAAAEDIFVCYIGVAKWKKGSR